MWRKANYSSHAGLQQRLINVLSNAKATQATGKVRSIQSVCLRGNEAYMMYLQPRQNLALAHQATLHRADCEMLAKELSFIDEYKVECWSKSYGHYSPVSEAKYAQQVRRLLKALRYFKKQIPALEFEMMQQTMSAFLNEYDTKHYRELVELGLRDANIKDVVRAEYKKNPRNLRRVVLNLARHERVDVRRFVAEHRDHIDVNIQQLLAKDSDPRIRANVAWTPKVFKEILEQQILNAEGLPDDCNVGPEGFDYQQQYILDTELYSMLYGKQNRPRHRYTVTPAEYLEHLKVYSSAVYQIYEKYYKRYYTHVYDHIKAALDKCYNETWWAY